MQFRMGVNAHAAVTEIHEMNRGAYFFASSGSVHEVRRVALLYLPRAQWPSGDVKGRTVRESSQRAADDNVGDSGRLPAA